MDTISATKGFTIDQVLNSNGFTLDTSDFIDLMEDGEEVDYEKSKVLSNQEMLRYLNLEEDGKENFPESEQTVTFIGISFDDLKPRMHSIYKDNKVLKMIKKQGAGEVVPQDAQVTVVYAGYFEYADEPFDTTYYHKSKQAVLRLGRGEMLPGLELAISSMKKFEKALFIIHPDLAYGKLGCEPRIPPNAEVLFSIELINYIDNGSAELYDELNDEDRKKFPKIEKIALNLLNEGSENVKMHKYKQAIREYSKAASYLEGAKLENDQEEERMNKILSRALSNLIICYNKIDKPKLACASFERMPNKSGKAYYQYGCALSALGEHDEAMRAFQKARKLEPNNRLIEKKIHEVEERRQAHTDFLKRFSKMSLQLTDNADNEFQATAIELCDDFIKDSLLKQALPPGLSSEEIETFRRVAATRNLSLTKQTRFNVDTYYLTKKSYYSKNYY